MIADAMEKVGNDGVITLEDSRGVDTSVDVVEGMSFDRGYMSQYMVTDNDKMEADLDNPYVLITDKKISQHSRHLATSPICCSRRARPADHCR